MAVLSFLILVLLPSFGRGFSARWLKEASTAISKGQVFVLDDFIEPSLVSALRTDARALLDNGMFRTSGLTNTAVVGQNFSTCSDRAICDLEFGDRFRGNAAGRLLGGDTVARAKLATRVMELRSALAGALQRDTLDDPGIAHEAGYSVYQPGAFLARHLDEHHEETKGSKGWATPSRRSVSWLVYLNPPGWDESTHGGSLRMFTLPKQAVQTAAAAAGAAAGAKGAAAAAAGEGGLALSVGAHEMNLQVGWLASSPSLPAFADSPAGPAAGGPAYAPVFMDCWHAAARLPFPASLLYVVRGATRVPVSEPFDSAATAKNFGQVVLPELRPSFFAIEDQATWRKAGGLGGASSARADTGTWLFDAPAPFGTNVEDVAPRGGRLVLFDSVTCPHEVTVVKGERGVSESRVAVAGWFHEQQQPFPV